MQGQKNYRTNTELWDAHEQGWTFVGFQANRSWEGAAPAVSDTVGGTRFRRKEPCTSLWKEDGARSENPWHLLTWLLEPLDGVSEEGGQKPGTGVGHTLIHTQQEWGTVLDRHVLHQTARTRPGTVFGKWVENGSFS